MGDRTASMEVKKIKKHFRDSTVSMEVKKTLQDSIIISPLTCASEILT